MDKRYWYALNSDKIFNVGSADHMSWLDLVPSISVPLNVPNRYIYAFKRYKLARITYDTSTFVANIEANTREIAEAALHALSQLEYVNQAMLDWHEPKYEAKNYIESEIERIAKRKSVVKEGFDKFQYKAWYNYKTGEILEFNHNEVHFEYLFKHKFSRIDILGEDGWARVGISGNILYIDLFNNQDVKNSKKIIKNYLDSYNIAEIHISILNESLNSSESYSFYTEEDIKRFIKFSKIPQINEQKLDELKFSQAKKLVKHPPETAKTIEEYLNSIGYKRFGSGSYARVYVKDDSNIAIKVLYNEDKAAIGYYNFLKTNKFNNPHFPKVTKIVKFQKNKELYLVFLEKLYPLPNAGPISEMSDTVEIVHNLLKQHDENYIQKTYQTYYINYINAKQQYPKLVEAFNIILDFVDKNPNYETDIHIGNLMKRADGTIVITDPLV